MSTSYLSPKVEIRESPTEGKGIFVKERIPKDELVADFTHGPGRYIHSHEAEELFERGNDHMIQVGDDLFFAATTDSEMEDADYINHSCEPNCGVKGALQLVALRDIEPGEEIAFDYAMSESSDFSFACNCGKQSCRKVVTGEDWKQPVLQKKYKGYFSDYLAQKIVSKK